MTDQPTLPEVMPIAQVAETLGCSVKTLRRAIDAGELVASNLARGRWVITRTDLLAWLETRSTPRTRRITPAGTPNAPRTMRRGAAPGGLREHIDRRRAA